MSWESINRKNPLLSRDFDFIFYRKKSKSWFWLDFDNETKKDEYLALFKLKKVEIDDEEKLIAYNLFNETARQIH